MLLWLQLGIYVPVPVPVPVFVLGLWDDYVDTYVDNYIDVEPARITFSSTLYPQYIHMIYII